MELQQIYYWLGFIFTWLWVVIGSIAMISLLLNQILHLLNSRLKSMWILLEFAMRRKEFRRWLKNEKKDTRCNW